MKLTFRWIDRLGDRMALTRILVLMILQLAHKSVYGTIHQDLSAQERHHMFGVDHDHHIPPYEYATFTDHPVDMNNLHNLKLKIRTEDDRTWDLDLTKNHRLLSPELLSYIRDGDQSSLRIGPSSIDSDCHYKGHVLNGTHKHSVAMSLCQQWRGSILLPDHILMLSPIPHRLQKHRNRTHVIYKRSANLLGDHGHVPFMEEAKKIKYNNVNLDEFCETEDGLAGANYSLPEESIMTSPFIFPNLDPMQMELAVFMDAKLYQHFKDQFGDDRAERQLIDFALAVVNHVQVLYQQQPMQPLIDLVIVRFEMWKSQPNELRRDLHKNGQAQHLLNAFCSYQAKHNPATDLTDNRHWDHAILLTGYDIYHTTTSVAGVAPVARMCDPQYSCSLVEGMHLGRSFVLAHEMGHNLGMVHDGVQNACQRTCCLMSPVNGAGKTTWSSCSVREINGYLMSLDKGLSRNCLMDSAIGLTTYDHAADKRLPGQRFTADEQCAFFWGRDYRKEIPAGRAPESICRILWCGNGGPTISTAHPALEGTHCNTGKWCRNGQCEQWPVNVNLARVNGQWSAWSVTNGVAGTVCSECKIKGGIRLRRQYRRCDDPAPNNDGLECVGSAVRGLSCPGTAQCSQFTNQLYGDRLCAAFRNDPHSPDRDLDGRSYVHPDSKCKVWCQLAATQLIRNKAIFPDGTPCGRQKYCVNGECLKMGCDGEAVVADKLTDCPSNRVTRTSATWREWAAWSACSVSCGAAGNRLRHRLCTSADGAVKSNCAGSKSEQSACPAQQECSQWSIWGQWSPCSATCGPSARRVRSRSCSSGVGCAGSSLQNEQCSEVPQTCARWTDWSLWTECTESCGGGHKTRNRDCVGGGDCEGHREELLECNSQDCPTWSLWSAWTPCTATCGQFANRHRRRLCLNGNSCVGQSSQTDSCDTLPPCPSWTVWAEWASCSVTCGLGLRQRTRTCEPASTDCHGDNKQDGICQLKSCIGDWKSWADWSSCSVSCDGGVRTRTRDCDGVNCFGSRNEQTACNSHPCAVWTAWDPWSLCSASCGSGTQFRRRSCRGNTNAVLITASSLDNNKLGRSGHDDELLCSGAREETRNCYANECPRIVTSTTQGAVVIVHDEEDFVASLWATWQSWSPCTTSCGLGQQRRRRECPQGQRVCLGSDQFETRACQNNPSCAPSIVTSQTPDSEPVLWAAWSLWSTCTKTCDGGTRRRRRVCLNAHCTRGIHNDQVETEQCNAQTCQKGSWSDWAAWSPCSRSCGTGGRSVRERVCLADDSRQCRGFNKEEQACVTRECPTNPTQPQALLSTSTTVSIQRHPGSRDVQTLSQDPNLASQNGSVKPSWSVWSDWSRCSCFNRKQMRRRFCQVFEPKLVGYCLGPLIQQKPCEPSTCNPVNGDWSAWSEWSSCSRECGDSSFRVRNRMCSEPVPSNQGSYCKGQSFEKQKCTQRKQCIGAQVNGGWSQWSAFGVCSASCGDGYKSRTRFCSDPAPSNNGRDCSGADFDIKTCVSTEFCESPSSNALLFSDWSAWGPWSQCSGTCGFSLQSRHRQCPSVVGACKGIALMNRMCATAPCTNSINGHWSVWAPWSECHANCGRGQKFRERTCSNPSSSNGGVPCVGATQQRVPCSSLYLPCIAVYTNEQRIIDLVVKSWENISSLSRKL